MIKPWETLASELVFDTRWYKVRKDVVRLPTGKIMEDYFVSVRPDVAIVFGLTEHNQVVLVRQYKQAVKAITLELPAGTFTNEIPVEAARRELLEETGYECETLVPLGSVFDDASKNSNLVHMFLGRGARRIADQELDSRGESAGIDIELLLLDDLRTTLRQGEIRAQSSVVAAYRALDELGR